MRKLFCTTLLCISLISRPAASVDVWLSGLDPVTRAAHKEGGESDFMLLFSSDSRWERTASKVRTLKASTQFLMRGSDDDLSKMFAWLRSHKISLAVELGFLSGDGTCGVGMEGYGAPRTGEVMAERVRRLGGNLAYIAMDEQLWFGKYAKTKTACHSSIPDIAREVAEKSSRVRMVFPDIKIGDIEPFGVPPGVPWIAETSAWLKAYRAATGENLAFLHADVQWKGDWGPQLKAAASLANENGIPFGVIINSGQPDTTDINWTTHAEQRLSNIQSLLGQLPNQLIFQSWDVNPKRFLPDDQPGTLTSLISRFRE